MSICEKCHEKQCLKTKKPCKALEKLIRAEGQKENIPIYRSNWIRPEQSKNKRNKGLGIYKEIPFSSMPKQWLLDHDLDVFI